MNPFIDNFSYSNATSVHQLPPPSLVSEASKENVGNHLTPPLWTLFDKLWTTALGYPVEAFIFTPGTTPLSTFKESLSIVALYYVVLLGGRELMRNRPAYKLNALFMIHNLYLTCISGGLLVLFVSLLAPSLWRNGLYDNICGESGWTQPLVVLYYLNYLTKYLEFLDTVFLVLKKKPLTFLHTYHHGATAFLCFTQLVGRTSISWVPITLNLTVHVVMYWYYFQSARGIRIWWKKYITLLQITQFLVDLGFIYFATWDYYIAKYAPSLPHYGTCPAGEEWAAFLGTNILNSYLILFIVFYLTTYKKPSRQATARRALRRASRAQMPSLAEACEKTTGAFKTMTEAVVDKVYDEQGKPPVLTLT